MVNKTEMGYEILTRSSADTDVHFPEFIPVEANKCPFALYYKSP